jgi:transposase
MRERLTLTTSDQQRVEVLTNWIAGRLTATEAALSLGRSPRTAWRLRAALLARGADGIVHGNRGRASPRRLAPGMRARIVELARTTHRGINDTHLAELLDELGIPIGRSSLQRLLRAEGLASPRRHRPPRYRSRRERAAQEGLLLQLDGSPHAWLEDRGPRLTLIGAIDDATGRIAAATFREQEDGTGYLWLLRDICRRHGIPAAVYRDRSGIFASPRPGQAPSPEGTQVGRALRELGVISIAAHSPQAKGRIERLWNTLQDRLVVELRLAGAVDLATANRILARFIPPFNRRFGVPASIVPPAWRAVPGDLDLDRVCAFRYRRTVGNDNTVRVEGAVLQLPRLRGGAGLAGRSVEVELRLDGRLIVVAAGRHLLAVAAPPEPRRLREIRVIASSGPPPAAGGHERPGWAPRADHPWRGGRRTTSSPPALTESLSR